MAAELRIERYLAAPHGLAPSVVARAARLCLPFAERCRSRLRTHLVDGREVTLSLARGTVLRGGDVLVAHTGELIALEASPEDILEARAGHPLDLSRAAYHLGNRHIRIELDHDCLRLEYDPVLNALLEGLGLIVRRAELPFEPEGGAYGKGHRHGHEESFDDDYALAQAAYSHHAALDSARQVPLRLEPERHPDPHVHDHQHDHDHAEGSRGPDR